MKAGRSITSLISGKLATAYPTVQTHSQMMPSKLKRQLSLTTVGPARHTTHDLVLASGELIPARMYQYSKMHFPSGEPGQDKYLNKLYLRKYFFATSVSISTIKRKKRTTGTSEQACLKISFSKSFGLLRKIISGVDFFFTIFLRSKFQCCSKLFGRQATTQKAHKLRTWEEMKQTDQER